MNIINCTTYFKIKQQKLFEHFEYVINDDDPVLELIDILEGLNLNKLKNKFKYKTKVHPAKLLAVIIYAYSRGINSVRNIALHCEENIKFKYILDGSNAPSYSTIDRFIQKCSGIIQDVLNDFVFEILKRSMIDTDNVYIDGTKIEAYANKYSFVWKKAIQKNNIKNDAKIIKLINDINNTYNKQFSNICECINFLSSKEYIPVYGKGKRKSLEQKYFELALSFLNKQEEYKEKLKKLSHRNSYSKTDVDATFMRMKEDAMLNGQLKPGYNLQIAVSSQYIINYQIFDNPGDVKTFIPFIEKIKGDGFKLKNIVADAGYESIDNYRYLDNEKLNSYIKPQNYEKSKTRKIKKDLNHRDNLIFDKDNMVLKRKDGLEFQYVSKYIRNNIEYFKFFNPDNGKCISYNNEFVNYSKQSRENILSDKGVILRLNRSIQVEGAFSVLKEDMKLRRLKVRGKDSVNREIAFFILGYNFNVYINKKKRNVIGNILHKVS